MTRWLILIAVVAALSAGAVIAVQFMPLEQSPTGEIQFPVSATRDGAPGKLVVEPAETSYNFGMMAQKETGEHVWTFRNDGAGEIELIKGESTCSCTIANFTEDRNSFILEPKKDTPIRLKWNTRETDGAFSKSADIHVIGDPNLKLIRLAVSGRVQPAMKVMPDTKIIDFGTIPNDLPQKGRAAIGSADRPDLKITSIKTTRPDFVEATFRPMPDEDRKAFDAIAGGYRIDVELKPSSDLGIFTEEILIGTDHPLVPEIVFKVVGKRVGAVSVFPETIRMPGLTVVKGGEAGAILFVRNAPEGTKFEVVETPENLKATVVAADVNTGTAAKVRQYRMTVTVPPNTPPGTIRGVITLKSNHPQATRVTIPVDVTVQGDD